MIKKTLKIFFRLLMSIFLGVLVVYGSMRFFGLSLSFPKENESIPIAQSIEVYRDSVFTEPNTSVKNVILFNVAGMGINQVLATRYRFLGKYGRLCMEQMPVTGLINNSPLGSNLISSPHAAATAIATGFKTFNGKLSPPGPDRNPRLIQKFQQKGARVGIITNSYITGATTAAFGSNVETRSQQRAIAEQMINNKIDLMIGGGNEFYKENFGPDNVTGEAFARANGYTIVKDKELLHDFQGDLLLGLFDNMYSNRYNDEVSFDPNNPTFEELLPIAIEYLSQKDEGFFLLIDDEGTDYGGYRNRGDYLTQHLREIDKAICTAIQFAERDNQTLILVTSEAEAGGMVITGGNTDDQIMTYSWGSTRHTGQMVPIFAYGPGAQTFTGVIENTDIHWKIKSLLNLN